MSKSAPSNSAAEAAPATISFGKFSLLSLPIFLGLALGWVTAPQPPEVWLGLTAVLSIITLTVLSRCMGWIAAIAFAVLSMAIALLSEAIAIGQFGILTHHLTPQIWNVPVPILLGWFVALASAYGFSAALMATLPNAKNKWLWHIGLSNLVATVYDLTVDPKGLAQGLWEWHISGSYASQIVGINGNNGIPWLNFVSWILITGVVIALFEGLCRLQNWSPQFNLGWATSLYLALCSSGLVWLGQQQFWLLLLWPLLPLIGLIIWSSSGVVLKLKQTP